MTSQSLWTAMMTRMATTLSNLEPGGRSEGRAIAAVLVGTQFGVASERRPRARLLGTGNCMRPQAPSAGERGKGACVPWVIQRSTPELDRDVGQEQGAKEAGRV